MLYVHVEALVAIFCSVLICHSWASLWALRVPGHGTQLLSRYLAKATVNVSIEHGDDVRINTSIIYKCMP